MVPFKPMLKFRLTNTLIIGTHFDQQKKKKIQKGKFLGLNGSVWTYSAPVMVIPIEDTSYTSKLNVSEWLDTPLLGSAVFFTVTAIETCRGEMPGHDWLNRCHGLPWLQSGWKGRKSALIAWCTQSTPIKLNCNFFSPRVYFKTWKSVLTTIMGWLLNDLTGNRT